MLLSPTKTKVLFLNNAINCTKNKHLIKRKINYNKLAVVEKLKNLGLVMDNTFRYCTHIPTCIEKAYTSSSLSCLYPHAVYLPVKLKIYLCDTLVLSNFNYCC